MVKLKLFPSRDSEIDMYDVARKLNDAFFSFNERTSFADGHYPNEPIMAGLRINYHLNESSCSKCRICFSVCRYRSIKFQTIPIFNPCVDCGLCFNACPCNAIEPSNKKNIAAPEAGDSLYSLNPTKINKQKQVIACKNALDDRSITILNNNKIGVGIIDCLGRLTAETMFDLCNKSKQVILVACTGEECHFASGSNKTEAIVFLVNKILSQLGNEQRIELIKTSKIENVINSYSIEKIIGGEKTSAKII